jgi:hypothetical protein
MRVAGPAIQTAVPLWLLHRTQACSAHWECQLQVENGRMLSVSCAFNTVLSSRGRSVDLTVHLSPRVQTSLVAFSLQQKLRDAVTALFFVT